jgi:SAM-dependent methyltransferase
MLTPLQGRAAPLDILDVCCASGRDLVTFGGMGHRAVGLDGVAAFCDMARARSGCEVLQQSLTELDLPSSAFDAIFCNACLFHVPRAALPTTLQRLAGALRPGGTLFVSNAHGFGEDREGWTAGRTAATRSYVCWLSEESWVSICGGATGLTLLQSFYRPPGKPPSQQPFLATVWQKKE